MTEQPARWSTESQFQGVFYARGGSDTIFDHTLISQNAEYQIEALGKSGTFSSLYRLKTANTPLDKQLAVKIPHLSRRVEGTRALLAEVDALKTLSGVNGVPSLVAYGTAQIVSTDEELMDERLPGLVQELYAPDKYYSIRNHLEFGTLRDAVVPCFGNHSWTPTDAEISAKVCASAARILRDCHERGVVHRDISDTNILLGVDSTGLNNPEEGIIDFGQSVVISETAEVDQSLTARARGTEIFESPEMSGECHDVIHLRNRYSVDLYSLGVLCYYLRISLGYSPERAIECFKASSDDGKRPGLFDLVRDLYTLGDGDLDKHPITQSDIKLSDIVRRLTQYQPKLRGTDDEAIASLDSVSAIEIGYDPGIELDEEEVKYYLLSTDTSFVNLARKSMYPTSASPTDTDGSDIFIPWQIHRTRIIEQYGYQSYGWTLVLGNEAVQQQYANENDLIELTSGVNWWNQEETDRAPWLDLSISSVVAPSYPSLGDAIRPRSMRAWFEGCTEIETITDLSGIDTAYVVDMSQMFQGCTFLREIQLPESWSYANVRTMESMFAGCRELVTMPWFYHPFGRVFQDVSPAGSELWKRYTPRFRPESSLLAGETGEQWRDFFHDGHTPIDTVNVENFTSIFDGCNNLLHGHGFAVCLIRTDKARYLDNFFRACESIIGLDLTTMSTRHCSGFSSMFENCSSLRDLIQRFDLTSLRWATSMFRGAGRLDSVEFLNEAPSKIIDEAGAGGQVDSAGVRVHASSMFEGCANLRRISLGLQFKAHPVTDLWHMMSGCRSLESVDLSGLNTIAVQDMGGLFLDCKSLTSITGIEDFDTESVSSLGSTFKGCTSLKQLDLHKWDTRSLKTIGKMCFGCTSLERIDISGWDLSALVHGAHAFELCPSEIAIIGYERLNAPRLSHPSQYEGIVPTGWITLHRPFLQ